MSATMLMATLLSATSLVLQDQALPVEDGRLFESFSAAEAAAQDFARFAATHSGPDYGSRLASAWEALVGAWAEFGSLVAECRDHDLGYSHATFDPLDARIPLRLADAGYHAVASVKRGAEPDALARFVDDVQRQYHDFIDDWTGGEGELDLYDSAIVHRAEMLLALGETRAALGEANQATAAFAQALTMLDSAIGDIVDDGIVDGAYPRPALGFMTTLSLEAASRCENQEVLTQRAERVWGWLAHQATVGPAQGDHSTMNWLSAQARTWAGGDDPAQLARAARLAEVVRKAYAQRWPDHLGGANHVWSTIVAIKAALARGDLPAAEALIAELEAYELAPFLQAKLDRLRAALQAEQAMAAGVVSEAFLQTLIDELQRMIDEARRMPPEGPSTRAPRPSGAIAAAGAAPTRAPPLPALAPPEPSTTAAPQTPRGQGRGWWMLAIVMAATATGILVVRRLTTRSAPPHATGGSP